ncbi:TIGR03619 family F420-dependent LLM class oxidoreductase [Herbidospora yilanensis]|uniref:TIGR03619 family F420-dependent LLM class oxidoreductase n=1 Tax=Herbidospora yilanensis TaxID=354426 RepID=UPI0007868103|nr:TIGR03619 family F420-dependent LLM class oxidoreductase [Herbidospora yilanensis]
MRIGFGVPVSGTWATPQIMARVATRAEELGYHEIWTFQRLLHPAGTDIGAAYRSVQDPIVSLAYVAALTSRIRLGVAVLNLPFFSPALLGKQLATLQSVSAGRLDAGLGLGWMEEEFIASKVPLERRGKRADEYLTLLRRFWTDDVIEHHGEFYDVVPSRQDPKPETPPPILLGGGAPAALRRAGRLADGWISSSRMLADDLPSMIDQVREAAAEAGREVTRFVCRGVTRPGKDRSQPLSGPYAKIREDVEALAEKGVTEVFHDLNFNPAFGAPDADPAVSLALAEEAMENLAPR